MVAAENYTVSIWIISFCAGITLFMALSLTRTLVLATDVENSIDNIASVYCIIDENSLASPFHDVRLLLKMWVNKLAVA